jgi:ubiquinone/menaquinone biosynthesis C-methylase UbiE
MEYPMLSIKRTIKLFADASLAPFGCEIRRKSTKVDAKAEGFPGYLDQANKIGMDVNEFQEQKLGWERSLPILEQTVLPYLREDSIVCNLGVGTGRWARHIAPRISQGELHLVDHSPWIVNFVRHYFRSNQRVFVHLNNGRSLPFENDHCIDLVFSFGTFIALKLGVFYLYSREFFRVVKPGGYCVIEYIDITRPEGWNHLETCSKQYFNCFTYHKPEVVESIFSSAGFEVAKSHAIGRSNYLVLRKSD